MAPGSPASFRRRRCQNASSRPFAKITFNGAGSFDASFVGRINGDPLTPSSISGGVYTVNSDCTGTMELTQVFRGFNNVQGAIVIVECKELFFVVNAAPPPANPAIIQIDGEAERASSGFDHR